MKNFVIKSVLVTLLFAGSAVGIRAQGLTKGPDPSVTRDAVLEKEAMHNLEVAQMYFKLRKAYRASLDRCEETITAYPAFSHFDEILYIAGMSSIYLADGQGKQKRKDGQTPEKLRDDAKLYLSQLVNDYPDSVFKADALQSLQPLGGPLKKD
jgi:outer membrane protein assembly factor BamD (BamD/ComL family)